MDFYTDMIKSGTFWDVLGNRIFASKPSEEVREVPDLEGKIFAVTGGYSGLGLETVKVLLEKNATVIILGRSRSKVERVMAAIREGNCATGSLDFVKLDFQDLESVRNGAEELMRNYPHLDALINSAGIMSPPAGSMDRHFHERHFAVNTLAHFHLTTLLLEHLLASPNHSSGYSRVVHVSSDAHRMAPSEGINFESRKPREQDATRLPLPGHILYSQSKLGVMLISNELHKRYASKGLVSIAVHPGWFDTPIKRNMAWVYKKGLELCFSPSLETGAINQLYAATRLEGKELGGKYIVPWGKIGVAHPKALELDLQRRLWDWCEKECEGW